MIDMSDNKDTSNQGPDPEPDVTKAPGIKEIDELWLKRQITFGEYRNMIREAKLRPPQIKEEQANTDQEIQDANYVSVPVGLLLLLYAATKKDSKIIQDKYGPAILDLLQKGELS